MVGLHYAAKAAWKAVVDHRPRVETSNDSPSCHSIGRTTTEVVAAVEDTWDVVVVVVGRTVVDFGVVARNIAAVVAAVARDAVVVRRVP